MRRALLALSGIVTCAGLVTALAANARFPQERVPGTIRVRVTLVPIDIIVTDKDDRPVTDLRQEDFTVIEDGVRQNSWPCSRTTARLLRAPVAAAVRPQGVPLL